MADSSITLLDAYPSIAAPPGRMCDEHCTNLPNSAAPPGGACYRCYASVRTLEDGRREKVLDLGVWIEMEGKLLICETCGIEIANALGFIAPNKADELRKANRTLGSENHQLKRKLVAAMRAVADLSDTIQDKCDS